jgi:hypothetical protein
VVIVAFAGISVNSLYGILMIFHDFIIPPLYIPHFCGYNTGKNLRCSTVVPVAAEG